jgi:hypothetical protein
MKTLFCIIIPAMFFSSHAISQEYGWQINLRQQNQWFDACESGYDPNACHQIGIVEKNVNSQSIQQRGETYENQIRKDNRRRKEQQRYTDNYYRYLERANQARIQGNYSSMYRNYEDANRYNQWANDLNKKAEPWYKFWN